MKNLIVLMIFLPLLLSAQQPEAELENIPDPVTSEFWKMYPEAVNVSWLFRADGYVAEFKIGNEVLQTAHFDSAGRWKQTIVPIESALLPNKVVKGLAEKFGGCELREACIMERPEQEQCYTTLLRQGKEKWEVIISDKGDIISAKKILPARG